MPPAVMDTIVGFLLLPPYRSSASSSSSSSSSSSGSSSDSDATTTPTRRGRRTEADKKAGSHKMASFFRFALCSKTCLGACERASLLMRTRAAVRDGNRLRDSGCDSVSKDSVRGKGRDLKELHAAQKFISRAVDENHWRLLVHTSVRNSLKSLKLANESKRLVRGKGGKMGAVDKSTGVPLPDFQEDNLIWHDYKERRGGRVTALRGPLFTAVTRWMRSVLESVMTMGGKVNAEGRERASAELGNDRMDIGPWMQLAARDIEDNSWRVYDGKHSRGAEALAQSGRIEEFCRLSGNPAVTVKQRTALLEEVVKCAKCEEMLANFEDGW
ncbi:hypothetical protein Pelo_1312 [Pelomyxa schiedti]|nr:hypothetical protein Pelo_1312 [Pelomyxa schiedti]